MLLDKSMCLHPLRASFSVGLHRAKTTEIRAKEGLCPQVSRLLRSSLTAEISMNGEVRPFAALRLFCIARFLARCMPSDLLLLHSDYFLHEACAYTHSWGVARSFLAAC